MRGITIPEYLDDNPDFLAASWQAQFVYYKLLKLSDDEGRGSAEPVVMIRRGCINGATPEQVAGAMLELAKAGLVRLYEGNEGRLFFYLPDHFKREGWRDYWTASRRPLPPRHILEHDQGYLAALRSLNQRGKLNYTGGATEDRRNDPRYPELWEEKSIKPAPVLTPPDITGATRGKQGQPGAIGGYPPSKSKSESKPLRKESEGGSSKASKKRNRAATVSKETGPGTPPEVSIKTPEEKPADYSKMITDCWEGSEQGTKIKKVPDDWRVPCELKKKTKEYKRAEEMRLTLARNRIYPGFVTKKLALAIVDEETLPMIEPAYEAIKTRFGDKWKRIGKG